MPCGTSPLGPCLTPCRPQRLLNARLFFFELLAVALWYVATEQPSVSGLLCQKTLRLWELRAKTQHSKLRFAISNCALPLPVDSGCLQPHGHRVLTCNSRLAMFFFFEHSVLSVSLSKHAGVRATWGHIGVQTLEKLAHESAKQRPTT